ncbi:YhgE/Pip domain-containing protein [Raoultibacter timonensis]|uniref:ABC transporter n=1 Tax=Raoultibacter timonensis TaxID=1907662 RepID=A0ABN6MEJ2_9ACTN|nr:YhgE/Pip domain-containing protein [Raoultibacter timonensis]BDE95663.1 ABC transporter [Raoultibacter timonensis]BDF50267.1 ABC transporter [Raoultibacter timonensis]
MRTVFQILFRDLRRLLRNPVAMIIVVGVCVIPSLYAWYCIAANWDPYANTAGIRVAVSNNDRGVQSDIAGNLDAGGQVVEELRNNHDLTWEFVSEDEAREGVESGTYYAAIVIPADFSEDLASVFTGDFEQPTIAYYVNEKKNAVAPKVTDTGAATIEEQINSTFVSTVSKTVIEMAQNAGTSMLDRSDEASEGLAASVDETNGAIDRVRALLDGIDSTIEDSRSPLDNTRQTLDDLEERIPVIADALDRSTALLGDVRQSARELDASISQAISEGGTLLGDASTQANIAIGAFSGNVAKLQGGVDAALADMGALVDGNEGIIDELRGQVAQHPELADVIAELEAQNEQHRQTIESLKILSGDIAAIADAAASASDAVDGSVQDGLAAAGEAQRRISAEVLPKLSEGLDSFSQVSGGLAGTVSSLKPTIQQARALLDQLSGTLDQTKEVVSSTSSSLAEMRDELSRTVTDLSALNDSASLDELSALLGIDPEDAASFMSSPVTLENVAIYPVSPYGSGVAPFYTNLALWVGGFILIAIFKLEVDREGVRSFSPTQAYLGRWLLFVLLGLVQAVIVCAGDLAIGVQCLDPVAYLAAGMFTSFVYVSVIFALASTFKHIGKAVAVVLLIMQIPGSSGMYPVEMMPAFFQAVHPFLPFTYGIGALREAVGGMYGLTYAFNLAHLALFLPVALIIGLVARPYLLNLNLLFDRKLAETDIMVCEQNNLPRTRYRLRTVIKVLLDTDAYRAKLLARADRFYRNYPRLIRVGWILVFALPVLILVVMSLFDVDVDTKIVMLVFWILSLIAVISYLIVVEYLHDNLRYQLDMSTLDDADLEQKLREHVVLQADSGKRDRP